jgi:hypothetical protein
MTAISVASVDRSAAPAALVVTEGHVALARNFNDGRHAVRDIDLLDATVAVRGHKFGRQLVISQLLARVDVPAHELHLLS